MAEETLTAGLFLDTNQFNAAVERSGEKLKSAFENFLNPAQIKEFEALLEKFGKNKNVGEFQSGATSQFANIERQQEEQRQKDLERIRTKYDSERQRLNPHLSDAGRATALAGITRREREEESRFDGRRDLTEVEKAFKEFLRNVGRATREEDGNNRRGPTFLNTSNLRQAAGLVQAGSVSGFGGGVQSLLLNNSTRIGSAVAGEAEAGSTGAMLGGVTSLMVTAIGIAVGAALSKGYDELRAQKKFDAVIDYRNIEGQDRVGRDFKTIIDDQAGLKFNRDEARQALLGISRDRMGRGNTVDAMEDSFMQQRAYGLEGSEAGAFDKFYTSSLNSGHSRESGEMILEIIARNERSGILGVKGDNFAALPSIIKSVESIMSYQKNKSDLIDNRMAIAMQGAGAEIGGAFADDRAGQTIVSLLEGLSSNSNPGMNAINMRLASKAMPFATPYELESGIRENEPGVVLEQLRFAKGIQDSGQSREMIERILEQTLGLKGSKLTRFIDNNGPQGMIDALTNKPSEETIARLRAEQTGRASKAVTNLDAFWTSLENYLKDILGKLAALVEHFVPNSSANDLAMIGAQKDEWNRLVASGMAPGDATLQARENLKKARTNGTNNNFIKSNSRAKNITAAMNFQSPWH